ncbi:MAG: hypothetical protein B7Y07_00305 [Halothiobacillus sp. 24-54-40]|nr:MAG: hypothetical protein B7Y58_00300 [Halothiobacillus sp. 35-54-62]OYY54759.1 MAG: hypothetical protein B7Y53_05355 [Halothiobacillus sp. 28-55-5]OYZ88409.1 MAG: hypothetical protein B7Y07_00305 [Halothiobacillus sp. 24-54-40]OZA81717.1 MAG: hypothetical protein B7X64_00315 [Halothiobacillus sp. 39-53-45]
MNAPVIFIDPARFPAVVALQLCGACLFWPEKLLNILGLWHEQRWHYARLPVWLIMLGALALRLLF